MPGQGKRREIRFAAGPLSSIAPVLVAISCVANLLALTGSLYMLQIYDRVISSQSVPTLIGLSILADLPWWVTVVILVREVGVTVLRFWVIRHGVIAASRGGKLKTLLQAVAIGLFVLPDWGWLRDIAWVVMVAAIVLAVVTGLDYVGRAIKLRRAAPGARVAA